MDKQNKLTLYKVELCEEYLNLIYDFDELNHAQQTAVIMLTQHLKKENE